MTAVFDTSSLLSLVRYYLPFDSNQILYSFVKEKIQNGEFVIIDAVLEECVKTAKGIVITSLDFLNNAQFLSESKTPQNTENVLHNSPQKFLRMVDSNFMNKQLMSAKNLTETEIENTKNKFLADADCRQIIFASNLLHKTKSEFNFQGDRPSVIVVTEETNVNNDNKLFKKIPVICDYLNIPCTTLPQLLQMYPEINLKFESF
ncbi:MAG: DUF4411 domain-containing protein [Candidatus Kapabacteria bacterium]|nr:DUF4411 domain-containing protein [Candidatus Kapabacteria bacterium]